MNKEVLDPEVVTEEEIKENNHIVVYNDDVNSFEHVIRSFKDILKHSSEQAEQCAMIIHYNGKCSVKEGTYLKLEPLCSALLDRQISAIIE